MYARAPVRAQAQARAQARAKYIYESDSFATLVQLFRKCSSRGAAERFTEHVADHVVEYDHVAEHEHHVEHIDV